MDHCLEVWLDGATTAPFRLSYRTRADANATLRALVGAIETSWGTRGGEATIHHWIDDNGQVLVIPSIVAITALRYAPPPTAAYVLLPQGHPQ